MAEIIKLRMTSEKERINEESSRLVDMIGEITEGSHNAFGVVGAILFHSSETDRAMRASIFAVLNHDFRGDIEIEYLANKVNDAFDNYVEALLKKGKLKQIK